MTPHDQHTERILLCVLAAATVRAETLKMEQRRPGVNAAPVSTLDGPVVDARFATTDTFRRN